jgi:hypothetical protein
MKLVSLLLGRSFGVLVGASLVIACSGSAFRGKDGQQELETGASGSTTASGGSETQGPDEPGGMASGGRSMPRGGTGGSTGKATTTLEPLPEGGRTSETGGSAVIGEGGGDAGPDPEPGCDSPVHDAWDSPLGTAGSPGGWHVEFGDPRVDLDAHELIVSYDDVATRNEQLVGGYVMAAEVSLSGYTVLTPYPYVWEVIVPSLRQSADGTGIDLGATSYGQGNQWRTDSFPGYGGVNVAGTTKARVTTYVQNESQQYAIKVEAGGKVFRSGWLGDFTWQKTNLQIFRFVGENNSYASAAGSDELRVGPVDGCQKLDDADVLKRYSE